MNPVYQVSQVINRRDEIANAASAGYQKGKAIDTSNFLNFGSKKSEQPISSADLANAGQPAPFEVWRNPAFPDVWKNQPVVAAQNSVNPEYPAFNQPVFPDVWKNQPVDAAQNSVNPEYPNYNQPVFPDVWKNQGLATPFQNEPAVIAPSVYNNSTEFNTTNLDELTRNITQNIANNNTTNQTSQANSQKIEVTYSPQVSISANLTKESQDNLMNMLRADKEHLMALIEEEQRKRGRLSYAG